MVRLVALAVLLPGLASAQPAPTFADLPYDTVEGVEAGLLSLDVYRPAGTGPFPMVVFVHGGGWHAGDKRTTVHAKADWLTARGVLLVSVNYRLSPEPTASPAPGRVTFPTHPEDVGRAVAFVAERAPQWDGDPDRIALMGHSTGAHLASLVATDGRYLAAAGAPGGVVDCVVSLDTHAYDIPFFLDADLGPMVRATYVNAFTADRALQAEASPATHLGGAAPTPFLVVQQSAGLRATTSGRFRAALTASGHAVESYTTEGFSHSDINVLLGDARAPAYTDAVGAYLDACLGRATSTAEAPTPPSLWVGPNPTTGVVWLRLPTASAPYTVVVRDARGRRVLQARSGSGGRLDLSALPPGAYLVTARAPGAQVRRWVTVGR